MSIELCNNLLFKNKKEPFLNRILIFDKKWVLCVNWKHSGEWIDRNEPPKQHSKPVFKQRTFCKRFGGLCMVSRII